MAGFLAWLHIPKRQDLGVQWCESDRAEHYPHEAKFCDSELWWERTQILNKRSHRQISDHRVMGEKPRGSGDMCTGHLIACLLGMGVRVDQWASGKSFWPTYLYWDLKNVLGINWGRVGGRWPVYVPVLKQEGTGACEERGGCGRGAALPAAGEHGGATLIKHVGLSPRSNGKPLVCFLRGS